MSAKQILVTGGTGFIGSHTVVELIRAGYEVIIADNLSNSNIKIVDQIEKKIHTDNQILSMKTNDFCKYLR
jgi:UDP-glucose 4-epimerase